MRLTVDSRQLPVGWVEKQLANLIEISHGYAFKGADFDKSDDITKPIVLTPGNYSENGELYFTAYNTKRLTGNAPPDGYLFDVGELTVVMTDLSSKMKILGKPAFINQPNILHNQRIGRIHFKDESLVPQFLYYLFRTRFFADKIKETATGTMVRHTAPNRILANKILVPPIPEQKRIVAILDEAFEGIDRAIANTQKNLTNSRELFESYLNAIFTQKGDGWVEKKLGDLSERITKGSSPKWQGINYVDEPGILFVTSENVGENQMLFEKMKYVEEIFNQKDSKSILSFGDVLTNIVGASIGRTAIYDREESANINQAVCLIRCNPDKLLNKYLSYLLNSPYFRHILHENEINNARANLSLSFFRELQIPLPSLEEQQFIVFKMDELAAETQRLETIYRQKIAALNELKQSILQKAFTGELTADTPKTVKEEIAA